MPGVEQVLGPNAVTGAGVDRFGIVEVAIQVHGHILVGRNPDAFGQGPCGVRMDVGFDAPGVGDFACRVDFYRT